MTSPMAVRSDWTQAAEREGAYIASIATRRQLAQRAMLSGTSGLRQTPDVEMIGMLPMDAAGSEQHEPRHLHGDKPFQHAASIRRPALREEQEEIAQRRMDEICSYVRHDLVRRRVVLDEAADVELRRERVLCTRAVQVRGERSALCLHRVPVCIELENEMPVGLPADPAGERRPRAIVEFAAGQFRVYGQGASLAGAVRN